MSTERNKRLNERANEMLRKHGEWTDKPYRGKKTRGVIRRENARHKERAIRLFLHMGASERIEESHLREAERKLRLPIIRLRLDCDVPFSKAKGRKTRIFEALRNEHPVLTRKPMR